ncbi:MAG: hypothetical protein CMB46_03335 [Euryarchaeota archaeon]|nr:hypothetical protein [Euryarchaeota archaeon]
MSQMRIEGAYSPISEPSPWWLRGLAIFMGLMAIFYAFNSLMTAVTPMLISEFTDMEWEDIEEYPEDGSDEEKEEWEEGKLAWEDMQNYTDEMMEFMGPIALHSGLLAIIGLASAVLLWTNREAGIKAVGAWIAVNFAGGVWMMWKMSEIGFTPIDDYGPEAGGTAIPDMVNQISMVVGVGQIAFCNGVMLAILVLVASKSKPETSFDIPSGFRQS